MSEEDETDRAVAERQKKDPNAEPQLDGCPPATPADLAALIDTVRVHAAPVDVVITSPIPAEPPCRCGSGLHPRRCEVHPLRYDAHRAEISAENASSECPSCDGTGGEFSTCQTCGGYGDIARPIVRPVPAEPPSNAGQVAVAEKFAQRNRDIEDGKWPPPTSPKRETFMFACSFCGQPESDVGKLIIGPEVSICRSCADMAAELSKPKDPPAPSDPAKAPEMRLGDGWWTSADTQPSVAWKCDRCGHHPATYRHRTRAACEVHAIEMGALVPVVKAPAPQREASAAAERVCGFHGCVRLVVGGKHDGRHFAESGYFDDEPATAKDTWLPLGKHPGGECALWCGSVVMGCPPEKEGAHYGSCFSVNGEPCLCSAYCNRRYRAATPERVAAGEPERAPLSLRGMSTAIPGDSEIGRVHSVAENSSGYLEYMSYRDLPYSGGGRWEVGVGCYVLWHTDEGTVHGWKRKSLTEAEVAALEARLDEAERDGKRAIELGLAAQGSVVVLEAKLAEALALAATRAEQVAAASKLVAVERARVDAWWRAYTVDDTHEDERIDGIASGAPAPQIDRKGS